MMDQFKQLQLHSCSKQEDLELKGCGFVCLLLFIITIFCIVEHHKKQHALLISTHESSISTTTQKVSTTYQFTNVLNIHVCHQIQSLNDEIANLKKIIEHLQCEVDVKAGHCVELQESIGW